MTAATDRSSNRPSTPEQRTAAIFSTPIEVPIDLDLDFGDEAREYRAEYENAPAARKAGSRDLNTIDDLMPQKDVIKEDYTVSLMSFAQLMEKYKATYKTVREVLRATNTEIRGSGRPKGKPWEGYAEQAKISPEQRLWLLRQHTRGVMHADIARALKISRERVRQIVEAADPKPKRPAEQVSQVRESRALFHQAATVERAVERSIMTMKPTPKAERVSKMWLDDMRIEDIATKLGMNSNSLGVQIARWRKRWPDKFPPRYRTGQLVKLATDGLEEPEVLSLESPAPKPGKPRKQVRRLKSEALSWLKKGK